MKQELSTQLGHAAVASAVTISGANEFGWFDYISANAGGFSVLIAMCSLLAALCFYAISLRKQNQNKIEIEVMKKAYKEEYDQLSIRLTEIKDLLKTQGESNEENKDT